MIRVTSAVQHCVVRDTDPGIGNHTTPPQTEPPRAADVPSKLSQARSNPKRTSPLSSLVSLVLGSPSSSYLRVGVSGLQRGLGSSSTIERGSHC